MFTGLVHGTGTVVSAHPTAAGLRMLVEPPQGFATASAGDSISVDGCCLTHAPAADTPPGMLAFDLVHETLVRTTLGQLRQGSLVHLEPSVTPSTAMGGHFVQGHVDALGVVAAVQASEADWRLTFDTPRSLMPMIVPKGSVTVDGVSLTIASVNVQASQFTVALIPTTLRLTHLGRKKVGDSVNLESDMLTRTIVHWLEHYASPAKPQQKLTMDSLRAAGFVV